MARLKIDISGNVMAVVLVKVRIGDINYGNHVGNDAFVSIIHEARLQWLKQNNFTELDITGTGLIMSDLAFEFKNEGFYGDEISIRLSAGEVTGVSFKLFYELFVIRNRVEILLANAQTGMVCFDYASKKVAKIPLELKSILLSA